MQNSLKVLQLIEEKKFAVAKEVLVTMNKTNIATLLSDVGPDEMLVMFRLLPKTLAAEVFAFLSSHSQELIVSAFSDSELSSLLGALFIDDVADIVEEMPANVASRILKNANEATRKTVNQILQYPEDSAGSLLTTEYVRLKKQQTASEALETIRLRGIKTETIYTCYVTDEERFLQGIVSLRDLVLTDHEKKLEEIMTTDFVFVSTHDDREVVAGVFKKYGFIALPVVDNEKRLVGIITVDDIMEVIEAENTEDVHLMAAILPSEEKYLDTSVFKLAKNRIFWLFILMITETFTGGIIEHFTEILQKCVVLTAFIPVLMDTGGNSGSQVSALIIRGLATGEIETSDILRILWKELRVGIFIATLLGSAMFLKNFFISGKGFPVSLTVSCALSVAIVTAKLVGATLPILAQKLKLDPATMSAPMLTTIVDTVSLLVYFSFAKLFIPALSV
ncbi:MAG: magnesium transporter [Treponemataceae bacterium]